MSKSHFKNITQWYLSCPEHRCQSGWPVASVPSSRNVIGCLQGSPSLGCVVLSPDGLGQVPNRGLQPMTLAFIEQGSVSMGNLQEAARGGTIRLQTGGMGVCVYACITECMHITC